MYTHTMSGDVLKDQNIPITVVLPSCGSKISQLFETTNGIAFEKYIFTESELAIANVKEKIRHFTEYEDVWKIESEITTILSDKKILISTLNNFAQYLIKINFYNLRIIDKILLNPKCNNKTREIIFDTLSSLNLHRRQELDTYGVSVDYLLKIILSSSNTDETYNIALTDPEDFILELSRSHKTPSWVLGYLISFKIEKKDINSIEMIYLISNIKAPHDMIVVCYKQLNEPAKKVVKVRDDWTKLAPQLLQYYYPELEGSIPSSWAKELLDQLGDPL